MKVESTDALVVVDLQNDFCPGGALAVAGGDEVVPVINRALARFRHYVFTRDWHPANHCSFSANPQWVDGSWPKHCVQNTRGAEFHPALTVPQDALVVSKATQPEKDAYSGLEETRIAEELRRRGVAQLFVCGLATDYCVKATALDGVRHGFRVALIRDACRGVDLPAGSAAHAIAAMEKAGITVCESGDLE